MASLSIHTLRRVAWFGLATVFIVDLVLSARLRAGLTLGVVMLLVFPIAVGLVSLVMMPNAAGTLVRSKDLLVPLALVTVAGKVLTWLAAAPGFSAVLTPSFPLRLLNLSFGISLSFLLHMALAVAYATWVTGCILELVHRGNDDPRCVLPAVPGRFWRVLGLEFIGWAVAMAAVVAILPLMPALGYFALAPMFVFAVAWNFATAAVLPVAWPGEAGFWASFRAGVSVSRTHLRQWWGLLLAQMLLLGLVLFYFSRGSGWHGTVTASVNAFWTGGYEDDCRWYGNLAKALHTPTLPLVKTLLSLLFGAFAVAIKITIVQRLQPEAPPVIPSAPPAGMGTDDAQAPP